MLQLRRLRRLVAHYGGRPQFVLASATIGNPSELASRLVGLPFEEVADDVSPRGEKLFALWNPPLVDEELGLRRSAVSETSWLFRELIEREIEAKEERASVSDRSDVKYPMLARALIERRDNLKMTIDALEQRLAERAALDQATAA